MVPKIKISGYTSHRQKETGRLVPGCIPYQTDFYTEMERIRDGYYKSVVEHLRSIEDPREKELFKAGFLPSITISCTCKSWRKLENVTTHSGLLNFDIDGKSNEHVTDWAAVRDDLFNKLPNIVACFLSAGGRGVTFVIRVNPEVHLHTFDSVVDSLEVYFKLKADVVTKDVVRLRFVSYDPGLKLRYNFNQINIVIPTEDYWIKLQKNKNKHPSVLPATEADSVNNFREGMRRAEGRHDITFCEGSKHHYLVKVAGYCNSTGMSQAFCEKMVLKHFRHLTHITDTELLQPVYNAYKTYHSQFSTTRLRRPKFIPIRHKRFLLKYVDKKILKKYNHLFYGRSRIPGKTEYVIKVDNPLLVYLMWLISPEYTWTCENERYQKYFSAEQCRDAIPPNSILEYVNGGEVWVNRELNYPANW